MSEFAEGAVAFKPAKMFAMDHKDLHLPPVHARKNSRGGNRQGNKVVEDSAGFQGYLPDGNRMDWLTVDFGHVFTRKKPGPKRVGTNPNPSRGNQVRYIQWCTHFRSSNL
jgi:hypothetical protein